MTKIEFAPDIDPREHAIDAPDRRRHLLPLSFRLFAILYEADLDHGEPLPEAELYRRLYAGRARQPSRRALQDRLGRLREALAGSRFAVEGDPARGWRLAVRPIAAPTVRPAPKAAAAAPADVNRLLGAMAAVQLAILLGRDAETSALLDRLLRWCAR